MLALDGFERRGHAAPFSLVYTTSLNETRFGGGKSTTEKNREEGGDVLTTQSNMSLTLVEEVGLQGCGDRG